MDNYIITINKIIIYTGKEYHSYSNSYFLVS
jgi:hypothetical protein